jgi:glycosyltransferase involved in cell wall biosynthesis
MAGYHAGEGRLVTHDFLPGGDVGLTMELDEAQQALKRRMLACHASQSRTLAQFGVEVERYRSAPRYDFAAPPHPGRLWYEQFDWGMSGARWRTLGERGARPTRRVAQMPDSMSAYSGTSGWGLASERADARPLTVLNVAFPFATVGSDAVGGAEQVLSTLDAGLVAAGHRSIVIAKEGSQVAGELVSIPLPTGSIHDDVRNEAYVRFRRALGRALDRWSIDLVHMHGIDFHRYLPPPGVPVLVTAHLPPAWYEADALAPIRPQTWLHGVSASQHRAFPANSPLLPPIDNGVSTELLAARHAKRAFALCLGRICPEKGFHLAIVAATKVGLPLLLAGAVFPYDAHERYFREQIAPRLDSKRRWIGPIGFARKRRLLTAARCLLVPSLVPETSSLVAMEALACGTPVVAFPSGALAEIIDHGRTGFLVADATEMADAIKAAAGLDPEVCRAQARERFPIGRMIAAYLQRYRQLVGSTA